MSTPEGTQELDIDAQLAAMEEDLPETQADDVEATQPTTDDLDDQLKALEEAVAAEEEHSNTEDAVQDAEPAPTQEAAPEATAPAPSPSPVKPTKAAAKPAAPALAAKNHLVNKKKPIAVTAATKVKPSIAPKKLTVRKATAEPADDAADAGGNTDAEVADAAPAAAPAPKAASKLLPKLAAPKPKTLVAPKPLTNLAKITKPAKAAVAVKAKPAKAAKDTADEAGPSAPVIKRPSSAYFMFMNATRPQVKADNEGISFGELGKRLGEMWKEMSDEEKEPFAIQAAEDKLRYEEEVEANGGVKPVNKSTKKAGAAKAVRVKTAYELFCQERRPELKKSNPKAGNPEIEALAKAEWAALDKEGRQPYVDQNKAMKLEAAQGVDNENSDDVDMEEGTTTATTAGKKRGPAASKAGKPGNAKRVKKSAGGDAGEDGDGEGVAGSSAGGSRSRPHGGDQDDEDEIDRENVDWEAHPAVAILSKTRNGKYVVARRGLPLHQFGEVSASAAAQRRSGLAAADAPECPVAPEMLDEFETFNRTFKREVFDNSDDGELDLDPERLQNGTLLETCAFLGAMRESGYELNSVEKKSDVWMKVPVMATSRLVQRMVDVKVQDFSARFLEMEAELKSIKAAAAAAVEEGGKAEA